MHALYQRLKELDWDSFQRLCFQLLSARHPDLQIKHVDGSGGDRGLDLFCGSLEESPTIWQCKQFPNGLGPRQRPKVTESLRTAARYYKPRNWILVISVDLDRAGHEWYQKLAKAYSDNTALGLFQASDIVRELMYRRQIRETFFPGAVTDSIMLRRALDSIESDDRTLQQLVEENVDEILARLEAADARFRYRITFGYRARHEMQQAKDTEPYLIASVTDENKQVDVFARDLEALRLDPPKISFAIQNSGIDKFREFVRTGKRQEFLNSEISNLKSSFDFVLPQKSVEGWRLVLDASVRKHLFLRVRFSKGDRAVQYDLVEFETVRIGTEEAEIHSVSDLPFVLSISFPLKAGGRSTLTIKENYVGADVRSVAKAMKALGLVKSLGEIELYDLSQEKSLGKLETIETNAPARTEMEALIKDLAEISDVYQVSLLMPKFVNEADLQAISFLSLVTRGSVLPIDGFTAKLVKSAAHEQAVHSFLSTKVDLIAHFRRLDPPPKVFGNLIDTGPIRIFAKSAEIADPEAFKVNYSKAKYGEPVKVRFTAAEVRTELGSSDGRSLLARPALQP